MLHEEIRYTLEKSAKKQISIEHSIDIGKAEKRRLADV